MAHSRPPVGLLLALGLILGWSGRADAAASDWVGDAHAAVRLITGSDRVAGDPSMEAGLQFRFAPGWHGYWRTPGDAGLAPVVDWSQSDNVDAAVVAWPAPKRLVIEGLQNSVYDGPLVLPVRVALKRPGGATTLRVGIDYAACSNVCVPFHADLAVAMPPGSSSPSAEASLIAAARALVPGQPAAAGLQIAHVTIAGSGSAHDLVVELRSTTAPFQHPDLFVEGAGNGSPAAPRVELSDGGLAARLTTRLPDAQAPGTRLTLTLVDGNRSAEFDGASTVPLPSANGLGWLAALGSALLGGFILNLMPCVLPVLSIKLLGLIRRAGAEQRAIRLGFAATALGIVACFLLLATVLGGLKWSGVALGWGIQFQQPWFLAAMATLTVLFAASFFEWLSIGLPGAITTGVRTRASGPLVEAFFTGMLATLLATPCSAPFVGTAVGFALAQGPAEIVGIFACLGLGMSLPYWAAALVPNAARWLPRPGAWMLVLRQVLGVLLLGTAVWLLLVLWSTAGGAVAASAGVALAVLLGLLAWRARRTREGWQGASIGIAVLSLVPIAVALLPPSPPARAAATPGWQAFDPDALPRLVAEGNTVLVDVTATWCLTCKVNDLAALETGRVRERLAQGRTIRMRADWSRPDPRIADYLHRFQRYGIPLDVVYGPGRPDGEPLPELLTPGLVLAALDRASAP